MRKGQSVLPVTVDDEQRVDEISDILDDCGAVDVDEHAQQQTAAAAVPERPAALESADASDTDTLGADRRVRNDKSYSGMDRRVGA